MSIRISYRIPLATLALVALMQTACVDGSYQHNPLRKWLLEESVTFINPAGLEETWAINDFAILNFSVERVRFVERDGVRQYTGQVAFRLFDPPTRRFLQVRGAFTYRDGERQQWELQKEKWFPTEVTVPSRWTRPPFANWLREETVEFSNGPIKNYKWPIGENRMRSLELGEPEVIAVRSDDRLVYQRPVTFSLYNSGTKMNVLVIGTISYRDGHPMPWNLEFEKFEVEDVRILE